MLVPDLHDLRATELGLQSALSLDPDKLPQPSAEYYGNVANEFMSANNSAAAVPACDNQDAVNDSGLREERR